MKTTCPKTGMGRGFGRFPGRTVKFIVPILILFTSPSGRSQGMPVYDNTNFISLAKQLIESGKQTAELFKMVDELNKVRAKLEKVSSAVRQYQAVRDITRNNQSLFDRMGDDLREIVNSPYIHPGEVQAIMDSFNGIMEHSLDQLDFMGQVLSSDFLSMGDAERLAILEDQREESQRMLLDIQHRKRRYAMTISFRRMQELVAHRETNY